MAVAKNPLANQHLAEQSLVNQHLVNVHQANIYLSQSLQEVEQGQEVSRSL